MFIDPAINPTTRAPAERNVCGDEYAQSDVSLLRSEENLLEFPFYKHYVPPTGRGTVGNLSKTSSSSFVLDSPVLATGCGWVNEEYRELAHYGVLELFSLPRPPRLRNSVLNC